jgi:hypothetical protein
MTDYALRMSPEERGRYRMMAASARELERWAAGYAEIDAADHRLRGFFPTFVAAARKPA